MKLFNILQKTILLILLTIPLYSNAQYYCNSNPVSVHGSLKVSGNKIVDKNNNTVSFAGGSLFWSNTGWGGEDYYTSGVVSWLEKDWDATIVRAAMGVEDNGGYLSDQNGNKNRVKTVVDAAISNGMYVIIDWHSHNAQNYESQAVDFFREMAQTYGNYPNVIYEIYNEPLQVSWSNTIKPYAEAVIDAIREIDSDNLIIVGTPTWSQDVDVASNDPIRGYNNIAYALHFYAGTHGSYNRQKAQTALNNGIALVVTEWGTVNANGDGGVNYGGTDEWMSFLANNDITHLNWAVNDKNEGASALKPGASTNGNWSSNNLTASGIKVKDIISNWNEYCSGNDNDDDNNDDNNSNQSAYPNGNPHNIPGTINATHYDNGGQGVSYYDNSGGNNGPGIRQNESVDTEYKASGGNVGWIDAGEWLEFTVDVQNSGNYTISYQVASQHSSGQFKLEFNGQNVTGNVNVPSTGNWGNFTTITSQNVSLNSGEQTMRLYFTQDPFNIGNITFQSGNNNDNDDDDDNNDDNNNDCDLPWTDSNFNIEKETKNYNSGQVDISCEDQVCISMDIQGVGPMENADYLNIYYKVNGGSQKVISENVNSFSKKTVSVCGISGNNVQIIIQGKTSQTTEIYYVQNMRISKDGGGNGGDDPQDLGNSDIVVMRKRNAMSYAMDGHPNGANNQNVMLWDYNRNNINQQWIEIDRGGGYYSYQKNGTNYCLDGGNGGGNNQNLKLWSCQNGNWNQHWKKINSGDGSYRLQKRNASGYSIDGNSGGGRNQNVKLWSNGNTNRNQHWVFEVVGQARVEQEQDVDLYVYPNPFGSQLTVELPLEVESTSMSVQLIDITGKVVYEKNQLVTGEILQINAELPNGFYFLKWSDEKNQMFATRKVIKQ